MTAARKPICSCGAFTESGHSDYCMGGNVSKKQSGESLAEARSVRRVFRRWLWLHPHAAIWRAYQWWHFKRVPPWRLTATMLAFINPAPLTGHALAGLMAMDSEAERLDSTALARLDAMTEALRQIDSAVNNDTNAIVVTDGMRVEAVRRALASPEQEPTVTVTLYDDPCSCGHDHMTGRHGSCGKFTCDCQTWRSPEQEPRP